MRNSKLRGGKGSPVGPSKGSGTDKKFGGVFAPKTVARARVDARLRKRNNRLRGYAATANRLQRKEPVFTGPVFAEGEVYRARWNPEAEAAHAADLADLNARVPRSLAGRLRYDHLSQQTGGREHGRHWRPARPAPEVPFGIGAQAVAAAGRSGSVSERQKLILNFRDFLRGNYRLGCCEPDFIVDGFGVCHVIVRPGMGPQPAKHDAAGARIYYDNTTGEVVELGGADAGRRSHGPL